jgi:hypothetical protein
MHIQQYVQRDIFLLDRIQHLQRQENLPRASKTDTFSTRYTLFSSMNPPVKAGLELVKSFIEQQLANHEKVTKNINILVMC